MKACTKCKKFKPLSEYSPNKKSRDGRQSSCRLCMNELLKKYYQAHRACVKKSVRGYRKENPEKISAHNALNHSIRDSKMQRPSSCEKCEMTTRVDGHHEDYNKPLEVVWLCRSCHRELHLVCMEV